MFVMRSLMFWDSVQVKDDVEMWKQAGKKGRLQFEDWTNCGFQSADEVSYQGELAVRDPDSGKLA